LNFTLKVILKNRLLIFTYLCISNFIVAQNDIDILGFVRDSVSGESLIGTNLLLYRDSISINQSPFRGVATNNYGYYAFTNLSNGVYFLITRNIGFKTSEQKIVLSRKSGRLQNDIYLIPQDIKLKEIIVEDRKQQNVDISSISVNPDIIKQLPSLSGEANMFKVLPTLPGVKVESEISNGLYVRGGSPDQNLTLLDGVIIFNPSHLGNFSSTFNSDAVQSVKLIKGAFPAEYGGRLSSVLDIKTRSGTKERDKIKLGLGLINSHFSFEGPLGSKATYLISGRKMYYDFIEKNFLKSSLIPLYNFYDLNGKVTITSSKSNIYTLSGLYSSDNLINPQNNEGINYGIKWNNAMGNFTWLYVNSKSLFITTSLSYIDYEFESNLQDNTSDASANTYYALSKLKDLNVKTNAEIYWLNSNKLKAGYEFTFHNYDLIYSDFYDPFLVESLGSLPNIIANEASVFIQNEGKITDWVETNIGVRGYYFHLQKYFNAEPRISAKFKLSDELSLNAAYAIAHQFLHLIVRNDISLPTDLWYPSSDKVKPSKSIQYVIGTQYNLYNKQYIFSLEGYYKSMKNLYEFKNGSTFKFGNSISDLLTPGEGEAYGIEFFANKTVGNLTGWIGYTLSWTKRKFNNLNNGKVFYPRYDRRNDLSIVMTYKFDDHWDLGLTWTYSTGQGFTIPDGQYHFADIGLNTNNDLQYNFGQRNSYRLPAYHKLDLNVSYKFMWSDIHAETFLSLINVYNRHNPFAFYPSIDNNNGISQITEFQQISVLLQSR